MPLFTKPVPIGPLPRGRDAVRENDSINALVETRSVLEKVVSFLGGYSNKTIQGADGKIYNVLGNDAGEGESISTDISYQPFQLVVETVDSAPKIRVIPSTLGEGSSFDLGFSAGDDPPYYLDPVVGSVYGIFTYDSSSGLITSRSLAIGTMPDSSAGTLNVEIGTVGGSEDEGWTAVNSRYGPITVTICRNWYASSAPYFSASVS